MSIAGVSASTSTGLAQQLTQQTQATAAVQAAAASQAGAAGQAGATQQASTNQQTGQAHHHHRHGGGGAPTPVTNAGQPATSASNGSTTLNTLA